MINYSQFRSLASPFTDLYAFSSPCSERSTLTFVMSVAGAFVTLEQIFAASVSKIILAISMVPKPNSYTRYHKSHLYTMQQDHNSQELPFYL